MASIDPERFVERARRGDRTALRDFDRFIAGENERLEGTLTEAVSVLRAEPFSLSWTEVGEQFGISRSAAQQRFGKRGVGGSRKPGGQPNALRPVKRPL